MGCFNFFHKSPCLKSKSFFLLFVLHRVTLLENLRHLEPVPSVQFHNAPKAASFPEEDEDARDPDVRVTIQDLDNRVAHPQEMSDSEEEDNRRDSTIPLNERKKSPIIIDKTSIPGIRELETPEFKNWVTEPSTPPIQANFVPPTLVPAPQQDPQQDEPMNTSPKRSNNDEDMDEDNEELMTIDDGEDVTKKTPEAGENSNL